MQVQQVRGGGKCEFALSDTHFTLDAKQLMQIFTQHHNSQQLYKDRKSECFYGGVPDTQEAIDYAVMTSGVLGVPYPSVLGAGLQLPTSPTSGGPGSGASCPGATTTTTTTTVVVTHGNGETETIIEGDNLPPGTNEMIMSAAAAAFPIDCYAMPGSALATTSITGGPVQVQSYQLNNSPAGLSVGMCVPGDLAAVPVVSPLTTTTMHTTTIINTAGGNFHPQITLPPHHPPPLPAAIAEAAAAAGLIHPSAAVRGPTELLEGPLRQVQQQPPPQQNQQAKSGPSATKVVQTLKQVDKTATPVKVPATVTQGTQSCPAGAVPIQKKQTAKRTRPFSQGPNGQVSHGGCTGTQKGGHSVASTQTGVVPGNEKAPKALDVDSATESNGETSLSIAAGQGHYEVVEFLLSRKAHIGKSYFSQRNYFSKNIPN